MAVSRKRQRLFLGLDVRPAGTQRIGHDAQERIPCSVLCGGHVAERIRGGSRFDRRSKSGPVARLARHEVRTTNVPIQHRPEQPAGGRDRHRAGVPFRARLSRLAAADSPTASTSAPYRWQAIPIIDTPALVRLRPVLRLAGRQPDVADVLSVRPVRAGRASRARAAGRFLSDRFLRIGLPLVLVVVFLMPVPYYPTYRVTAADPSVARLLAALAGAAVLAVRAAVVPVAAAGAERAGGGAASLRAADGANASAGWRPAARDHPVRFFVALVVGVGAGLCAAGA